MSKPPQNARRLCPCGCAKLVPMGGFCDDVLEAAEGDRNKARILAHAREEVRQTIVFCLNNPEFIRSHYCGLN